MQLYFTRNWLWDYGVIGTFQHPKIPKKDTQAKQQHLKGIVLVGWVDFENTVLNRHSLYDLNRYIYS